MARFRQRLGLARPFRSGALALVLGLGACQSAPPATHRYATITHTAKHINATRSFNEVNPGIGLGLETSLGGTGWSLGAEAGLFRNSNQGRTAYGAIYADRRMSERVRLGAFYGLAQYPDEAARNRSRGQIAFGDFIPILGLQATLRTFDSHAFRVRITPGLSRADAIVTLQSNLAF